MTIPAILLPVFVQVLLIFLLLGMMASSRMAALKSGTRASAVALDSEAFPPKARQIAHAYRNQFEMPVLFFAAVILAIAVRQAGTAFVLLEWVYVAARIAQAYVHVTSNNVGLRGPFFLLSALCTLLLWALIATGVLIGTP